MYGDRVTRTEVADLWDDLAQRAQDRGQEALALQRRLNAETQRWMVNGMGHGRYGRQDRHDR